MKQSTELVSFTVDGDPQQRGSKNAFAIKMKNGTTRTVVADSNKRSVKHLRKINVLASEAMRDAGKNASTEAIIVTVRFMFERPKCHYGTGKNSRVLKDSAPVTHTKQPDIDKLVRCLLDGMTGAVYLDDRQVVAVNAVKQWSAFSMTIVEVNYMDDDCEE